MLHTSTLHDEIKRTLAGLEVYRDPTTHDKWLHIRNEDGTETHSVCVQAVKLAELLRRVERHIAEITMLHTSSLHKELHTSIEGLTVYGDRVTQGKWLHIHNENVAVTELVHILRKHMEAPRGYELTSPASNVLPLPIQRIGVHSAFDPYGTPWLTYHEIGAVLHCYNRISLHDGTIQSIHDRLYAQEGRAPPGLAQALALTETCKGCTWYTMNTHGAKRQGLLSHCACCVPASVMRISWERTSSKEHLQQCQETLYAWIGLNFKMLPGSHRSIAKLPCV